MARVRARAVRSWSSARSRSTPSRPRADARPRSSAAPRPISRSPRASSPRCRLVGVVGDDFPKAELDVVRVARHRLQRSRGPARAAPCAGPARYHEDMNVRDTLSFEANVFDGYMPTLPAAYCDAPFVFLANIAPALQARVLDQVRSPRLIGCRHDELLDRGRARASSRRSYGASPLLIINDEEARMLSGERNMIRAARKILDLGPTSLMIKRGEYGVLFFSGDTRFLGAGLSARGGLRPDRRRRHVRGRRHGLSRRHGRRSPAAFAKPSSTAAWSRPSPSRPSASSACGRSPATTSNAATASS